MENRRTRQFSLTTLILIAILAIFYLLYKAPSMNLGFPSHNKTSETISSQNQPACIVDRVIDGDTFVRQFSDEKKNTSGL
jgi:hypothetical protein